MSTLSVWSRAVVAEPVQGLHRRLSGLVMPYNTPAEIPSPAGVFVEQFAPGAFATSLRERPVVPLYLYHADQHAAPDGTTPHPIGISEGWSDKPNGLYGDWMLDTSEDAQNAARMAKAGILPFMSVMFNADTAGSSWQYRDGRPHVTRTKATLVSVSLTATPAYPQAAVTQVRHISDDASQRRRRRRRRH